MNFDIQLFYAINSLAGKSLFWDRFFIIATQASVWIFVAVTIVYLFVSRKVFWAIVVSTLISRLAITEGVRLFYDRLRPFVSLSDVHQLILQNPGEPSFPSGHTTFLFPIAFTIYLFNKKIGVSLITAALIFTFARVYVGVHYPLDIVGGIVVALVATWLTQRFFIRAKK